jgi:hypothetical protein
MYIVAMIIKIKITKSYIMITIDNNNDDTDFNNAKPKYYEIK